MIWLKVDGVPAPQGSKNQFGAESNPRTRPWRAAVTAAAAEVMDGKPVLTGPVRVHAAFVFTRPKGHYRTGKNAHLLREDAPTFKAGHPDLDKLCRAIGDSLTGVVLRDDKQIVAWDATKSFGDRAFAQIVIEPLYQTVREDEVAEEGEVQRV